MRLRYLAAAPLLAAALFGTTAAAWPPATAPLPQAPPAPTSGALSARYAADARAIGGAAREAARDGDIQLADALAMLRTQHVLFFSSSGQGLAAMVIGNLATATRVAILVPGSDTTLATFFSRGSSSPGGGAFALAAEARRLDPGAHLAIIAWLGSCRISGCSGWASATTRCRPGSARASSPPAAAGTAATWTLARSRYATWPGSRWVTRRR